MMVTARVTVFVQEDTVLRADTHVFDTGEVQGWLSLDDDGVSLWGSPALSRLAVALLGAANAAERVGAERAPGAEGEAA
ncbi:MAG: hypothetical protein ACRDPC_16965 [Solirubrobacteraceae bacterium]